MISERRQHWEDVYAEKPFAQVSWYQEIPEASLRLIIAAGARPDHALIDVGGGASTLVDHLLERGFGDLTVLDISAHALEQARTRLGSRASRVQWEVGDITSFAPHRSYDLWHDRAVLHFLTSADDRRRYVEVLEHALAPGGQLVLGTFGPDGPEKCSGLAVRRYSIDRMAELLGPGFELKESEIDMHKTPWGAPQQFLFSRWSRKE
ncbi:MAG: class I SAM-dependent methyltransferase [Woeseiaceae bacterium]